MSNKKLKLSENQMHFLNILAGLTAMQYLESDDTYSPYPDEMRTFNSLIKLDLAKWRSAGYEGYRYTGISLTEKGKTYVNEYLKPNIN